ncbi:hypothetical protein PM082_023722 [Marasmius tenuissimus]|nr:hypothetical protein PM082_023722 [Marasmius tenuissimus]
MNDRDSAYADPAIYTIDATTPITSTLNDTDPAYADPSTYIINTTFDSCPSSLTVTLLSMPQDDLPTTDLNRCPVEDVSKHIDDTVNHQSRLLEKDQKGLFKYSGPSPIRRWLSGALNLRARMCYVSTDKEPVRSTVIPVDDIGIDITEDLQRRSFVATWWLTTDCVVFVWCLYLVLVQWIPA